MIFTYDACQEKCPVPLVNTRLLLKKMKNGDSCVLKLSDSGSIEDIPKLLSKLGYCYHQSIIDNNVVKIIINHSTMLND
ncbi:MAG: sulfurtransferase TusA family protein [Colwellia sp.]